MGGEELIGVIGGVGKEDSIWRRAYCESKRYSSWDVYKDQYGNEVNLNYEHTPEDDDNW